MLQYMEDVNSLASELTLLVQEHLSKYNVQFDDKQEDVVWETLQELLEEVFGYPDYRNHN